MPSKFKDTTANENKGQDKLLHIKRVSPEGDQSYVPTWYSGDPGASRFLAGRDQALCAH
jgi:hypothetical protein